MSAEQSYVNLYQATRDSLMVASPKVMNTLRDEAINVFAEKGFPSRKVEDYRYIDVPQAFDGKDSYAMPLPTLPLGAAQSGDFLIDAHACRCGETFKMQECRLSAMLDDEVMAYLVDVIG